MADRISRRSFGDAGDYVLSPDNRPVRNKGQPIGQVEQLLLGSKFVWPGMKDKWPAAYKFL
jgi:hypothetical protein